MAFRDSLFNIVAVQPALSLLLTSVACAGSFSQAAAPPAPPAPRVDSGLVARITTLKENGARLDWHEDQIAFDKLRGEFYAVYLMRADGSDERCLTCDHPDLPGRHTGQPAFHPAGRYLVVQAEKAEHERVRFERVLWPGAGVYNDLWLLDLETGRATLLRQVGNRPGQGTLHAHFSRDGARLSWSEMRQPGGFRKGREVGLWALMVADFRQDSGPPRLENVREYTPGGAAFYENHGFSPDGTRLIFTSNFEAERRFGNHIYVMDLRSGTPLRLTDTGYNEHALFSPDGHRIIWMTDTGNPKGGTDYWMMEADGAYKQRLTYFNDPSHPHYARARAIVADFAWSPDGTAIAAYFHTGGPLEAKTHPTKILLIELRTYQR